MIYLNLLYFIIITWYGYRFLTSTGRTLKSPFDKDLLCEFTGPETFWILTFSTGLLALSSVIDLKATRLFILMFYCLWGLKYTKHGPIWSFPLTVYVVYLLWLVIGCFYAPSMVYGIRTILKYLYPLAICLFASAVVDNMEVAMKASLMARKVAMFSILVAFVPFLDLLFPGIFWYATARAIHYISIMTFSIALYFYTEEKSKNLRYAILFLLPCFLWVFRTSIMGSGVAIMAFAIIRWKLRAAPVIAGVLIAGVIAVFTIPSLRQKMFKEGTNNATIENFQSGKITRENVETNAREGMWKFFERKFYKDHELAGSGTGAVQHYFYTHYIFGGLRVVHSDFVQMKCDNGMIGLVLYILVSFLVFGHCFLIYWGTHDPRIQLFAITAGASMLGVFATLYSDNTVNYSMATLSMPYGFYGMAMALNKRLNP